MIHISNGRPNKISNSGSAAMKDVVIFIFAGVIGLMCAARLCPPVGTHAYTEVRRRLMSALTSLGAEVTEHPAVSCGERGQCAQVVSVIAQIGPALGTAVAVVGHYDSVGPSPGAADDGAGLTIALALAQHYQTHPPAKPLMLVLTNGEELGLFGAQALVREGVLGGGKSRSAGNFRSIPPIRDHRTQRGGHRPFCADRCPSHHLIVVRRDLPPAAQ